MMTLTSFIYYSIALYVIVFIIINKVFPRSKMILLILSLVAGVYLNILDNGNWIEWLNMEFSKNLEKVSTIFLVLYMGMLAFFSFKKE